MKAIYSNFYPLSFILSFCFCISPVFAQISIQPEITSIISNNSFDENYTVPEINADIYFKLDDDLASDQMLEVSIVVDLVFVNLDPPYVLWTLDYYTTPNGWTIIPLTVFLSADSKQAIANFIVYPTPGEGGSLIMDKVVTGQIVQPLPPSKYCEGGSSTSVDPNNLFFMSDPGIDKSVIVTSVNPWSTVVDDPNNMVTFNGGQTNPSGPSSDAVFVGINSSNTTGANRTAIVRFFEVGTSSESGCILFVKQGYNKLTGSGVSGCGGGLVVGSPISQVVVPGGFSTGFDVLGHDYMDWAATCENDGANQEISVMPSGPAIDLQKNLEKISVFPVPSSSIINVNYIEDKDETVSHIGLYHISGMKIKEIAYNRFSNNAFEVDHLESGIYFIRIETSKGIFVRKVEILR